MSLKKILIVDDDEAVRSILAELVRIFGFNSETSSGGYDALNRVDKSPYDLIITDINMPDLNGLELIKRVKESHPEIDLIAITGFDMDYRYTDVIEMGASDFIVKPFENNELQAKINRVFREQDLRRKLENLSVRDGLTDLYNRRYFEQRLREEIIRAHRQKYPLFLLLIDIDHFKMFNDTNGHQGGDHLLKELAKAINHSIRNEVDTGFRYGGDEFGVIAPQVNRRQASMIAHRIIKQYKMLEEKRLTSLSIGIAQLTESNQLEPEKAEDLIKHADVALFRSKRLGGGRIELYESSET
jgi:two-component system, cell cycle response regulator